MPEHLQPELGPRVPIEQAFKKDGYGIETISGEYADYDLLLRSLGYGIQEWITCGSYQGDHVALLRRADGAYGFTVIGYGSCSGCDALEGCGSLASVDALRDELDNDIEWNVDPKALAATLMSKDEANHWWLHDSEMKAARDKIVGVLNA